VDHSASSITVQLNFQSTTSGAIRLKWPTRAKCPQQLKSIILADLSLQLTVYCAHNIAAREILCSFQVKTAFLACFDRLNGDGRYFARCGDPFSSFASLAATIELPILKSTNRTANEKRTMSFFFILMVLFCSRWIVSMSAADLCCSFCSDSMM
jgi:hypothetical protein